MTLSTAGTASAGCIDYRRYPHLIGGVDTPGTAHAVAVSGSIAYIADGTAGLQIIDVSDLRSPSILGAVDTPGDAVAISISGSIAYVADGSAGLQIIDISDPAAPRLLGSVDTPGTASGVTESGSIVYVADGGNGLHVVDVTDPSAPAIVGSTDTPGFACGAAVLGDYVYVADGHSGLEIINAVNPDSPQLVGSIGSTDFVQAALVSGSSLYFLDKTSGLRILDIQAPSAPSVIGSIDIPDYSLGLALSGTFMYVSHSSGLEIVDIRNPSAPFDAGFLYTPASAAGVALYDSYAIVADDILGLVVADVQNPVPSVIESNVFIPYARPLAISGNYAFVGDSNELNIVDVGDPSSPRLAARMLTQDAITAIVAVGSNIYVLSYELLSVINVTNPHSPTIVDTQSLPCCGYDLAISGSYVYVAGGGAGMELIYINDDHTLLWVYSFDVKDVVTSVGVGNDYVLLGGIKAVRTIGDLNQYTPRVLGSVDTPGTPLQITLRTPYAFVAGEDKGLQVIDLSNLASPNLVGTANTQGKALGVTVSDSYAYVAADIYGCQVFDISVPDRPEYLGGVIPPRASARGIVAAGSQVYLTQYNYSGLFVLPVQCPSITPVELSYFQASSRPDGVLLEWDVADEFDLTGFNVVRSMDRDSGYKRINTTTVPPSAPFQFLDDGAKPGITYYYRLQGLYRSGETQLVGMASAVLPDPEKKLTQLGQAFPNPFQSPPVDIPFTITEGGPVRLRILDVSGRQVRLMMDQVVEAGARSISWDGKDDRGERVPSGVYQYEIQTKGFHAARKLIRLR